MNTQQQLNYNRVAEAIKYIRDNFREQPSLNAIAESVHLSPYHFQRLFSDWAGVSPKKFMQYISVEYAKQLLKEQKPTLFDTAMETGLSGTGRLHDLFVRIEGMTPGEFKNAGESLTINYSFAESPFGNLIVASTSKGVCHMAFIDDEKKALTHLQSCFAKASYRQVVDQVQQDALFIFQNDWRKLNQIKLHLNATPFQLKVWDALLKIPQGCLTTYGALAEAIAAPKSSRRISEDS